MIKQIEKILWNLVCRGGGDADTLREDAEKIAKLFAKASAKEKSRTEKAEARAVKAEDTLKIIRDLSDTEMRDGDGARVLAISVVGDEARDVAISVASK